METLPVSHYLRLREQGLDHNTAAAHTLQTFGCSMTRLAAELTEARERHIHVLQLLEGRDDQERD